MILLKCNILKTIQLNNQINCEELCQSSVDDSRYKERVRTRKRLDKAQTKLTVVVFLSTLKCLIGRLPIFFFFILQGLCDFYIVSIDDTTLGFIYAISCLFVYFSYAVSFFFYYHGNRLFRNIVKANFVKLQKMILKTIFKACK